jgi:hypothetical protein
MIVYKALHVFMLKSALINSAPEFVIEVCDEETTCNIVPGLL